MLKTKTGTIYHFDEREMLHRVDGPAVIWTDGSQSWYQNDKLHREDGPAVIVKCRGKTINALWYYHGRYVVAHDQASFNKRVEQLKREHYADQYL